MGVDDVLHDYGSGRQRSEWGNPVATERAVLPDVGHVAHVLEAAPCCARPCRCPTRAPSCWTSATSLTCSPRAELRTRGRAVLRQARADVGRVAQELEVDTRHDTRRWHDTRR